jgi:hypothetical protein
MNPNDTRQPAINHGSILLQVDSRFRGNDGQGVASATLMPNVADQVRIAKGLLHKLDFECLGALWFGQKADETFSLILERG